MPGFACLNAGVVRIGRHLAKRRNIMWRLQFDLSREENSPDPPGKGVNARTGPEKRANMIRLVTRYLPGYEFSRAHRSQRQHSGTSQHDRARLPARGESE